MKPPSTVEARVAEELRNWLSSELEQLDASNTNQFAHHVVTILLHEDLDIDDEPLSAGDDFLRDIYSIRRGKTRDKQKKAAVQFLRSAVCCDEPGEAEIQGVVDELMVKIEETKIRMNSKCSPKRISTNGHNSFRQPGTRGDSRDTERLYNEAFPSLLSSSSNNTSSVWHRLAVTASDGPPDLGRCRLQAESAHRMLVFDSQDEAHACNTARRVFISTLPETVLPSLEATEVLASSEPTASLELFSLSDAYTCWSTQSAFQACSLLRKFLPTTYPLKPASHLDVRHGSLKDFNPTIIPVINQSDLHSINLDPSYEKTLTDHPQLFRPIKERNRVNDFKDIPLSETDLEVARIFHLGKHFAKQKKNKLNKALSPAVMSPFDGGGSTISCDLSRTSAQPLRDGTSADDVILVTCVVDRVSSVDQKIDKAEESSPSDDRTCQGLTGALKNSSPSIHSPESQGLQLSPQKLWDISYNSREPADIDDVCTFPQHHGGFWKLLTDAGSMALYPVVSDQMVVELEDKIETRAKFIMSPLTSYQQTLSARNADDLTQCRYPSDLLPDMTGGSWMLESACVQVQYHYAVRQVAHVQQTHISRLQNPFMPSLLSSCLSNEGSQILQRAFVNSYFSDLFQEPLDHNQDQLAGIRCSDLEHCWLSTEMLEVGGLGQAKTEVVPGCTCSSWLENNCQLGELCPFSHPSI